MMREKSFTTPKLDDDDHKGAAIAMVTIACECPGVQLPLWVKLVDAAVGLYVHGADDDANEIAKNEVATATEEQAEFQAAYSRLAFASTIEHNSFERLPQPQQFIPLALSKVPGVSQRLAGLNPVQSQGLSAWCAQAGVQLAYSQFSVIR